MAILSTRANLVKCKECLRRNMRRRSKWNAARPSSFGEASGGARHLICGWTAKRDYEDPRVRAGDGCTLPPHRATSWIRPTRWRSRSIKSRGFCSYYRRDHLPTAHGYTTDVGYLKVWGEFAVAPRTSSSSTPAVEEFECKSRARPLGIHCPPTTVDRSTWARRCSARATQRVLQISNSCGRQILQHPDVTFTPAAGPSRCR